MEKESDEFPELRNAMKHLEATKLTSTVTASEIGRQVARCAAL
jgi:hypothetical protein